MRARLVVVTLAVTTMVVIAFVVPLGGLVRQLARDRALSGAERDAQLIAQLLTSVGSADALTDAFAALGTAGLINGNDLSVVLADGELIGAAIPETEDLLAALLGSAGSTDVTGGAVVYVPAQSTEGIFVVRVFVADAVLTENVARAWLLLGALGLILILIGAAVADRLGRTLVLPVEELSRAAHQLGAGDLSVRVQPSGPPELFDVGTAFNRLAGRIEDLIAHERESAADLSHRLRTPLTAARLDLDRFAESPDKERLAGDLDELERTVNFIIDEVRRPVRRGAERSSQIAPIVAERAAFWSALAEEQHREVSVSIPATNEATVAVPTAELAAAIDAILGNVFAHTAEGVPYRIVLETTASNAQLVVEDSGDGFPDLDVVERGTSGGGSSGLGLDIARGVVRDGGGSFTLSVSAGGGARVVLELPLEGGARTGENRRT